MFFSTFQVKQWSMRTITNLFRTGESLGQEIHPVGTHTLSYNLLISQSLWLVIKAIKSPKYKKSSLLLQTPGRFYLQGFCKSNFDLFAFWRLYWYKTTPKMPENDEFCSKSAILGYKMKKNGPKSKFCFLQFLNNDPKLVSRQFLAHQHLFCKSLSDFLFLVKFSRNHIFFKEKRPKNGQNLINFSKYT